MKIIWKFAPWLALAVFLRGDTCAELAPGKTAKARCFLVEIQAGQPAMLAIPQTVDLEIRVDDAVAIDSFAIGRETATLLDPGSYRVEARAVSKSASRPVEIIMSREALPLPAASLRRRAEQLGTRAKASGKSADTAAARQAWQETGDLSAVGRIEIDQGDAAIAAADFAAARDFYEQAVASCQSAGDLRCLAEAANNSGYASEELADFEPAQSRLQFSAEVLRRIGEVKLEGQTFSNLGLLLRHAGDFQGAISYDDRARAILESRDAVANARVLNNLGLCYQSLAEYDLARDYLERALAAFAAHHSARDAVRARLNLGHNALLQGDAAGARAILDRALADATAASDRAARADTLLNLGQTLLQQHAAKQAAESLQAALELHRADGDRRGEASDLHFLGMAALAQGDAAAARSQWNQALQIRLDGGLRDAATDSLFALADLERTAGNSPAARRFAERALELLEAVRSQVPGAELRASYYARRRRFFDLLVDLEASRGAAPGLLASERGRGRALMDLLAQGSLLPQIPPDLLNRRRAVQRRIDLLALRLSTAPDGVAADLRRQVELLAGRDEEIEARIRQTVAGRKLGYELSSLAALQGKLPRDSAFLEYHLGENGSYLWLVKSDSVQAFPLPPRGEIETESAPVLELFPEILARRRSPEKERQFERALRKISATLTAPLRPAGLPRRLLIVPDGVLTQIPFAALETGPGQRLGLAHDVIRLPSAAYLAAAPAPRPAGDFPRAILAVSDPVYSIKDPRVNRQTALVSGPGLARLPFTQEIQTITGLVPPARRTVLTAFDANVETIEKAHLEDYAVVHFSTHALIDDRIPELSRVALSMVDASGREVDGFLRPYQFSRWTLRGSTVVLSACDTALGKQVLGEGLAGLAASLFSAGAGRLALTISDVDAEASAEFWSEVYRRAFAGAPVSLERAVTLARQNLAGSARWSDPYYWAPYVIYGAPSKDL